MRTGIGMSGRPSERGREDRLSEKILPSRVIELEIAAESSDSARLTTRRACCRQEFQLESR